MSLETGCGNEAEFFVFSDSNSNARTRYLFRLFNSDSKSVLTMILNTDAEIVNGSWRYILMRFSKNTLEIYIEGSIALSRIITQYVTLF